MVSIFNLIGCLCVLTLLVICCQIQAKPINSDENDSSDFDAIRDFLAGERDQALHEQFRRASLRYHPHILYKKASLKPLIGYHGKMVLGERDRF